MPLTQVFNASPYSAEKKRQLLTRPNAMAEASNSWILSKQRARWIEASPRP